LPNFILFQNIFIIIIVIKQLDENLFTDGNIMYIDISKKKKN
jgi:hypothetical protein